MRTIQSFLNSIQYDEQAKKNLIAYIKTNINNINSSEVKQSLISPQNSYLQIPVSTIVQDCINIIIDIGGSSTKAALSVKTKKTSQWVPLFYLQNIELQLISGKTFDDFCEILAKIIVQKIDNSLLKHKINLGIIWSNSIKNFLLKNNQGIGGEVFKKDKYLKNEWFIASLKEKQDLSSSFLSAFKKAGFKIGKFIITNDTPATLLAHVPENQSVLAGMVLSTGINITILEKNSTSKFNICNSEIGTSLKINHIMANKADHINKQPIQTVGQFCRGLSLPKLFETYIFEAAKAVTSLVKLNGFIQQSTEQVITNRDIDNLVNYKNKFCVNSKINDFMNNDQTLKDLQALATYFISRSAMISSCVAYGSVCNILSTYKNPVISLDSRLCRESKFYWQCLQKELTQIDQNIQLALIEPVKIDNYEISVPIIGLNNAFCSDCITPSLS